MDELSAIHKVALEMLLEGLEVEEDGCVVPTRLGTQLGMPSVEFYTWLRQGGLMYRQGIKNGSGKNLPTQEALNLGLLRIDTRTYKGEQIEQPLITPKGIERLGAHFLTRPSSGAKKIALALCVAQGWAHPTRVV